MTNRRFETVNVFELIRPKRLSRSHTEIAQLVGCTRPTVVKYVAWAREEGFLAGALPERGRIAERLEATLPQKLPPQQVSSLEAHRERVKALRDENVEIAAIRLRLQEETGERVSYEVLRRLVRQLEPHTPEAFVRDETAPGDEAQVDLGSLNQPRRKTPVAQMTEGKGGKAIETGPSG